MSLQLLMLLLGGIVAYATIGNTTEYNKTSTEFSCLFAVPTGTKLSTTNLVTASTTVDKKYPPNSCPEMPSAENINTLVKCKCKGGEVLSNDGNCTTHQEDTYVDIKGGTMRTSEYTVITKDITCDEPSHRLFCFKKGHFYYRANKGHIVLQLPEHELDGQRIHRYCIEDHLDSDGNLTSTLKGCVPQPAVRRCCPFGQAMKDGSCQPASTPVLLEPPISAKPHGDKVSWPKVTHFFSPLICDADPVKTYPLSFGNGHLISLAAGITHFWNPPEVVTKSAYSFCKDFCIDGIVDADGTITYNVSLCYSDQEDRLQQACANQSCIHKCCSNDKVVSVDEKPLSCRYHKDAFFNLTQFNVVNGWPISCGLNHLQKVNLDEGALDERGYLTHSRIEFSQRDYCIDSFLKNSSVFSFGVFHCPKETEWERAQNILFPFFDSISVAALVISIFCHLVVPGMMKYGGSLQLFHALFLAIAYLANVINLVNPIYSYSTSCFCLAIIMQFGYLGAFFWLNVMCFELWRTTRNLKTFMRDYKKIPTWYFIVYATGGPVLICLVTVVMQLAVPEDALGLIKPGIGYDRCWFKGDLELLAYFYGHIGVLLLLNVVFFILTLIEHRQLMRKYKTNMQFLKKEEARCSQKVPKHIADHVPDFTQKMRVFMICAFCWVTEVLSWKIPPKEVWALTDCLNTLQGVALFLIFLGNRNKRKLLRKEFPRIFKIGDLVAAWLRRKKEQLCPGPKMDKKVQLSGNPKSSNSAAVSELAMEVRSVSLSTISVSGITALTSIESLHDSSDVIQEHEDEAAGT